MFVFSTANKCTLIYFDLLKSDDVVIFMILRLV